MLLAAIACDQGSLCRSKLLHIVWSKWRNQLLFKAGENQVKGVTLSCVYC